MTDDDFHAFHRLDTAGRKARNELQRARRVIAEQLERAIRDGHTDAALSLLTTVDFAIRDSVDRLSVELDAAVS